MKLIVSFMLFFMSINLHAADFFKEHGLVLFFSSQCPHCQSFAPVIKSYSDSHQAPILALSFDNQPLKEFPVYLPATPDWVMAAFNNNPITYPALFIVNKKEHRLYPVSTGSMGLEELESRMNVLIPKVMTYEEGKL